MTLAKFPERIKAAAERQRAFKRTARQVKHVRNWSAVAPPRVGTVSSGRAYARNAIEL